LLATGGDTYLSAVAFVSGWTILPCHPKASACALT
jgi:hypothetical protein